jgi:hypothetical protein
VASPKPSISCSTLAAQRRAGSAHGNTAQWAAAAATISRFNGATTAEEEMYIMGYPFLSFMQFREGFSTSNKC